MKRRNGAMIGVAMAAFAALMAFSTTADASYRARSTMGGFFAWVEDLFDGGEESSGETSDAGVRMDDNG